jgi:hypothetical protein
MEFVCCCFVTWVAPHLQASIADILLSVSLCTSFTRCAIGIVHASVLPDIRDTLEEPSMKLHSAVLGASTVKDKIIC